MLKGEWIYILSKKFNYYTKEVIKLINIMAIGMLILTAITLMKFKVVYTVYIDDQEIGNIQSKRKFEQLIKESLYNNEQENIAFSEMNSQIKYTFNLMEKDVITTEDQTLATIKENADITYYEYAINVKGKERQYVKTEETAKEVCNYLKEQLGEDTGMSIDKVYTKELQTCEEQDVAVISNNVMESIKADEKREKSTINGVYISVIPVQGHITSRYGSREAIRDHTHQGLDIATKTGTPIKAAADGTVTYSDEMGGYGNLVIINHGNGIQTYYGHCSKIYVKEGKTVKAGDVIAAVGSTGNSTGPHLHFEIRRNGKYIDPANYLYN